MKEFEGIGFASPGLTVPHAWVVWCLRNTSETFPIDPTFCCQPSKNRERMSVNIYKPTLATTVGTLYALFLLVAFWCNIKVSPVCDSQDENADRKNIESSYLQFFVPHRMLTTCICQNYGSMIMLLLLWLVFMSSIWVPCQKSWWMEHSAEWVSPFTLSWHRLPLPRRIMTSDISFTFRICEFKPTLLGAFEVQQLADQNLWITKKGSSRGQ